MASFYADSTVRDFVTGSVNVEVIMYLIKWIAFCLLDSRASQCSTREIRASGVFVFAVANTNNSDGKVNTHFQVFPCYFATL